MSIALALALIAAPQAGVTVEKVPQIGVATRLARCIVRQVGVAPADAAARTRAVEAAVKACRAFTEADFEAGRITLAGRPVSRGWWSRMQQSLDAVQADVAAAIRTPAQYTVRWKLDDGKLVDAYDAQDLKAVTLVTVPL